MAVAAVVFATGTAFAGGSSSGSSKSKVQYVHIKNNGTAPVLVNAKNGSATTAAGGKTVAGNGVAKFKVKNGVSQAYAQDQTGTLTKTLPYYFPKSVFVYLLASTDNTTVTLTFAPERFIF